MSTDWFQVNEWNVVTGEIGMRTRIDGRENSCSSTLTSSFISGCWFSFPLPPPVHIRIDMTRAGSIAIVQSKQNCRCHGSQFIGRNSSAGIHPPMSKRRDLFQCLTFQPLTCFRCFFMKLPQKYCSCSPSIISFRFPITRMDSSALLPPYFRPSFFLVLADPSLADSFWDPLPSRAILYETLLRILNWIHRHPTRDSLGSFGILWAS